MKLIVPIDFSKASTFAAEYAAEIAKSVDGNLILLNVFTPTISANNQIAALNYEMTANEKKYNLERLQLLVLNSEKLSSVNCEISVKAGNTINEIVREAESVPDSIIILGLKKKGLWQELFGRSVATAVFEKTFHPILLIPETAKKITIQNILFITEGDPDDLEPIDALSRFAKKLSSKLSVLRLTPNFSNTSIQTELEVKRVVCSEHNKFTKLLDAVRDKNPQLLAYSENQNNILKRFIQGNPIERAVRRMNIPYIIFNRTKIGSKGNGITKKYFIAP